MAGRALSGAPAWAPAQGCGARQARQHTEAGAARASSARASSGGWLRRRRSLAGRWRARGVGEASGVSGLRREALQRRRTIAALQEEAQGAEGGASVAARVPGAENGAVPGERDEREASAGGGELPAAGGSSSQAPAAEAAAVKKKGYQSSWTAKDVMGDDYLYRLGKESDNLSITVGAKEGMIDQLFVGDFLGKEADIVFKYRQKVTRSFQHIQGDYYIAPLFLEKVVTFLVKNYLVDQMKIPVPLILGVWGGKGQGKSFQLELICKAMDIEPVIMSAGEMESEWAGQPGKLIRERYRTASQVIKNKGKMSCLIINDLDAGVGRFANTQVTVNNQMVFGTLMNLCDAPTRVSIGQDWRMADVVNRVPIIVTGNDFSTLWAPLVRDGRMDKFYWQPTREDLIKIVYQMYIKDNLTEDDITTIIDTFPNQALDFYGALRSRTYDEKVLQWVNENGGAEKMGAKLVKRPRDEAWQPITIVAPTQKVADLIAAGNALVEEQRLVMENRLSDVYFKKQTGAGGLIGF